MRVQKKSMWRLGLLGIVLTTSLTMEVQGQVSFEPLTFDQAKAKAAKERKIIFVDVMRGGIAADQNKHVEENIFTIDSIAGFFRDNCISIRMDMASEAGKAFAPNLNMLMYPAYVFYDAKGAQLSYTNAHAVAKDAAVLMQKAKESSVVAEEKRVNTRSIAFEDKPWLAVLQQAKKEGKLIFLDAQTEWCRPCRMMERDVFTLDRVADYYNDRFINVSMDMEKGDGPALVKQYEVRAYPTYLFINGDGEVVHRDGGFMEGEPFLAVGEKALQAVAQESKGIAFTEGTWDQLLARAEAENKLIFLDGYAVWCGPCKQMDKNVFSLTSVGEFFNSTFINVKIDMEKGEGIMLKDRYDVKAYPTYLFINGKGEEVHRIVGSSSAEKFVENSRIALQPEKQLATLEARYDAGERGSVFLAQYLDALTLGYKADQATKVATAYLESIPQAELLTQRNFELADNYLVDPSSRVLAYFTANRRALSQLGIDKVDEKLENKFSFGLHRTLSPDGKGSVAEVKKVQRTIDKAALPHGKELLRLSELLLAAKQQNWKSYVKLLNQVVQRQQPIYGQSATVSLAFFGGRLLRETGGHYAQDVIGWTDALIPSMENALDRAKLYDLKHLAYKQSGDEENALLASNTSKELTEKWQKENGGSGAMMMIPMKMK